MVTRATPKQSKESRQGRQKNRKEDNRGSTQTDKVQNQFYTNNLLQENSQQDNMIQYWVFKPTLAVWCRWS